MKNLFHIESSTHTSTTSCDDETCGYLGDR